MHLQLRCRSDKKLGRVRARSGSTMHVHVTFQSKRLPESFLTNAANVHLVPGVCDHVVGQVVCLGETLVTQLAAERPLGAVRTGMPVAVVSRGETFAARATREHVGTVHMLDTVSLQRVRVGKAFRADGASVRLVSDTRMTVGHVFAHQANCWKFHSTFRACTCRAKTRWRRRRRICSVAERHRHLTVMATEVTVELVCGQKAFSTLKTDVCINVTVVLQHVALQGLSRAAALTANCTTPHLRCRQLHLLSFVFVLADETALLVAWQLPVRWQRWWQNVEADVCGKIKMGLHVSLERENVRELPVTDIADVVSVGKVGCHVAGQMMWQTKLLTAHLTRVWTDTTVAARMSFQLICLHANKTAYIICNAE